MQDYLDLKTSLAEIVQKLSQLEGESESSAYLEFAMGPSGEEFRVKGNSLGLVQFATHVLQVAAKSIPGAHQHFDEAGIVDKCQLPLVVVLENAPWDEG